MELRGVTKALHAKGPAAAATAAVTAFGGGGTAGNGQSATKALKTQFGDLRTSGGPRRGVDTRFKLPSDDQLGALIEGGLLDRMHFSTVEVNYNLTHTRDKIVRFRGLSYSGGNLVVEVAKQIRSAGSVNPAGRRQRQIISVGDEDDSEDDDDSEKQEQRSESNGQVSSRILHRFKNFKALKEQQEKAKEALRDAEAQATSETGARPQSAAPPRRRRERAMALRRKIPDHVRDKHPKARFPPSVGERHGVRRKKRRVKRAAILKSSRGGGCSNNAAVQSAAAALSSFERGPTTAAHASFPVRRVFATEEDLEQSLAAVVPESAKYSSEAWIEPASKEARRTGTQRRPLSAKTPGRTRAPCRPTSAAPLRPKFDEFLRAQSRRPSTVRPKARRPNACAAPAHPQRTEADIARDVEVLFKVEDHIAIIQSLQRDTAACPVANYTLAHS